MSKAKAYYSLLLLLLTACGQPTGNADQSANATPFFKLESYFDREITRMDSLHPVLLKKVTINGKTEEQRIEATHFEDELQVFRRSDINRPSWSDKYQIDSLLEADRLTAVRYTALDTSLNTRLLQISYQDGKVAEIEIRNKTRSAIASTEQHLFYRPDQSYRIESRQKTMGSEPKELMINVEIGE